VSSRRTIRFRQYYWARGHYDVKGVLPLFTQFGAEKCQFQFASVAAEFALIDSPTCAVVIPWQTDGIELCQALRQPNLLDEPWRVAKLARKAQRYAVNVWPNEFKRLQNLAKIEPVHDEWWILGHII
jgi:CRISPR-associated endonuclease/helicase Cas3